MRIPAFAAFCLLLISIGYAQSPGHDNLLVKSGEKVVFMGDSITGMGWGDTGGYIHLVVAGLDALGVKIEPIPSGVGGNTSISMLARLKTDALDKKPDWLLLSCGVNDVWSRKVTLDTFKKNITSIVDQAQAAGIKVMILTPTPIYELAQTEFSRLSENVAWMVQLAHDRKLPLADENAAYFANLKAQHAGPAHRDILTIDGVHPNPDGHQILATTVLQAFGATPGEMGKIKAAWLALPDGASLPIGYGLSGETEISAAQDAALEKIAVDRKMTMTALVRGQMMSVVRDAMVAHGGLDGYTPEALSKDAAPRFGANIEKLAPPNSPAAGDAKAVAHDNKDGFTAAVEGNGNVKLGIAFGFRGTTAISIPQFEKLKQIAITRKLPRQGLVLSVFMAANRDTLVARGDVSNVHQDNISHDSWPLYDKYAADLVK